MHYQNDVLHVDGKVRVGVAADDPARPRLIASAARLIAGARANGVPVIFVRIAFAPGYADCLHNSMLFRRVAETGAVLDGQWGAEFYAELAPLPGEAVVTHKRNNPFCASGLEEAVRSTSATRLYMAGIATNHVVEHGARHASDLGYDVAVVADACSTAQPHLHAASLETLGMLADVMLVDEAIARMKNHEGLKDMKDAKGKP
ncbi:cysteine hydrolase family protein [Variovorax sp. DXTD-1]|uniref:cysteine hydrolase family protein n=1 Tax=Variovorax sp. DXTD-1 TaxID=2495592 RepID=UPI000F87FB6D|nr:isochorismatase family cysteine hydrolase [Variovorax sp. DXTD-1]RST54196.1 cysteine hydrolase [Variovorax sp. DXTD-1]